MAKKKTEGRLNEHLHQVKTRYPVSQGSLEPGMIIEGRYKSLNGESKRHLMCILNPYYLGKIHAVSLDKITYVGWNRFVEKTGLRNIESIKGLRALNIPKVIMDDPRRFYRSNLVPQFNSDLYNMADSYRTYFYGNIKGLMILDYKFNAKVEALWRQQQ